MRLGEERKNKRKKKEKRKRSKSNSPSKSKASPTTADQETRAERLAANLGDLLIDLPTTEAAASPPCAAVDLSDIR